MSADAGLFDGLRVVELATVIMVPSAGALLADYGADVIKVEQPEGDTLRRLHLITGMPESEIAYCHLQVNRNKRGVVLDLKRSEGLEALRKLIATADIFLSNFRPRALQKLGLCYDDLKADNPRLIHAHGTGWGDVGPECHKPGYDTVCYFARSGFEQTVFPHEGWLAHFPPGAGDQPSGVALFSAIVMALYRRERTGEGMCVSTSLLANGAWANACLLTAKAVGAEFLEKRPRHNAHNFIALHYRGADEGLFRLTIVDVERDWPKFCAAIELDGLVDEPRFRESVARRENMAELIAILDARFAERDRAYWLARLDAYDVPHAISATYDDIAGDAQMEAIGVYADYEHPLHGKVRSVHGPMRLTGESPRAFRGAPGLGAHTREVLSELYSSERVEAMLAEGVAIEG